MPRHVGASTSSIALLVAAAALAWLAAGPFSPSPRLHAAAAQEPDTDTDGDTMPDLWEGFFGLSPGDPTDASADPDGDGLTNAQEYAARRHPVGRHVRHFAEGATGYFDTTVALLNPSPTDTAHVALALLLESGGVVSHQVTLGPRERQTISIDDVLGTSAAVSLIVESDVPVAADRWMTWGTTGIGASLDSGAPAPGTTWYFAEGATGPFLLYYLFENPSTERANVTVRYLIEGASAVATHHVLEPQSRTTVFVNSEDPALAATSVGAVVTSDVPIFAERAMYVNAGGALGGGSASAASTQAATQWYFGEGSTGPFFHTFLALLNPGSAPATATVTYHLSDGTTASKAYDVPAEGRRTVYFNGEAAIDPALAALATGPVWFTVDSTQPIVGERAMWWAVDWPWYEGHAATGSTTSGVAWAVPEGRHGGPAVDQTYVLVGNTTATPGHVRLTLIPDAGAAVTRDVPIGAGERLTLNVGDLFELTEARFSVIVESLGTPAAPLAVDYARYRSVNGLPFSGGGATPAIPVPISVLSGQNLAPTFTAGANQTVPEDAAAQTVAGWATAITPGALDEADQTVTFAVTANTNAALFSVAPAVSPTGTLTFTPAPDANGTATITLVLRDNGGTANGGVDTSAPQTVSITVEAVNDAPTVVANDPPAIGEDAGPQSLPNWATSSAGPADETPQTVGYTVNGVSNPQLFSTPPAVDANGTLTYTPAADANGIATFQVAVQDDGGTDSGGVDTSVPQTFTITVEAVNDVPSFTASDPLAVDEDAGPQSMPNWAAFSAGPDNESAQTATYVVSSVSNPLLFSTPPAVASNGTLTYAPAADATGIATFDVAVRDNGGTANGGVDSSAPQAVTITVNAINDAPVLTTAGGPLAYTENDPATAIDPTITVIDVDSATLTGATVQITGNHQNGEDVLSFADTATITGTFTAASGLLTLTGTDTVANYQMALQAVRYQNSSENPVTADRTITWMATDGITPSLAGLGTITVATVNDAPSFTGGANHVSVEDTGQRVVSAWASSISAGPASESAQALTFVVTDNTNPGMFSAGPAVSSTGTLTYTAARYAHGTATITLVVQDDGGTANGSVDTSAPHTFTITIMDSVQVTLQKTLTTAPANLDMTESYRLRIAVENIPGVLQLTSIGLVADTVPPGTVFDGATPQADCEPGCVGTTPARLNWTHPCATPLMPGSSCDITVNVTFPSSTFSSGTNVTNSFTVDATALGEPPQTFGPAETTHAVTTFVRSPNASFSKNIAEGTPTPPTLNQTFSYDVHIVNDGNVALDNLVVIDTLPVEMRVTSIATGAYTGLSDFGPGEGVRVSYEKNTALGVFTLWGSSPNAITNTLLTAPPPGLGAGESLTRIRWEYGQAGPGMAASSASTRPLVTGQIINPDHAGGPVAIGDSIQNCAALTAVDTVGPTSVNRSDCETFSISGPFVQLDPAKENLTAESGSGFQVGEVVEWRLRVRSAAQSSDPVPLEHLVVTDLVPVGLTANSWTFDAHATGLPAPQSFEEIPNFAGTGRTLLRWRWNAGSGSLGVGQQVSITIPTTVNGALGGAPASWRALITNAFALDHDAPGLALRCAGSSSLDTHDLDGDGNTSETLCTGSETIVTINSP